MQQDDPGRSSELSARVGRRITALRTSQGLSLSALARVSGLSKSTLSELERGRRTATLDSLFAITTALTAPLSDLLLDVGSPARPDGEHGVVSGSAVTADLLDRLVTDSRVVEVFRIVIGRDGQLSAAHGPGVQEVLTVLSGEAVVGPATAPIILGENETARYCADVPHLYRSPHGAVAILLMVYPGSPAQ